MTIPSDDALRGSVTGGSSGAWRGSTSSTSEHRVEAEASGVHAAQRLYAGQRLGRYVIGRRLGMGGFGVVYAALDESLDRAVAIKVLWPGRHHAGRISRLRREARAMARLQHPNIVTVFDVGLAGDHPYIVMERVDGGSMRWWLSCMRPDADAIVAAFLDVARGLAVAHRAGLVHRDIKLSNLLVGRDGRVLVSDFGLAAALTEDRSTGGSAPGAGTAAYMAPERFEGGPSDERTDQYALCVALYTALCGEFPFEDLGAKRAGRLVPTALRELAPRVRGVLARGLAACPSERFASIDALIEALERRPGRRWGWALGGVVLAAGLGLAMIVPPRAAEGCEETASASLWPRERRDAVVGALSATEASFAGSSSARIDRRLSDYAGRWSRDYRAACAAEVTTLEQRESLESTVSCLRRSRLRIEALAEVLATADRSMVEHAVPAVEALLSAGDCGSRAVSPWARGSESDRIERHLARSEVLRELGRYADAESDAQQATRRADASGATAAAARARLQRGLARLQLPRVDEAVADLEAAYFAARGEHDEPTALRAAIELLQARVAHRPDLEAATRWERVAEALMGSMATAEDVGARLLHAKAERAALAGDRAQQVELHRQALALRRSHQGEPTLARAESLEGLGRAYYEQRELDGARALFAEVLEIRRRLVGREHPLVAVAHNNYGVVLVDLGEGEQALAELEAGLAGLEASLGAEHPRVGRALSNLGSVMLQRGSVPRAHGYIERAVAILRATQGPVHPDTLSARASWVKALRLSGEPQRAAAEASRIISDAESVDLPDDERAALYSALGGSCLESSGDATPPV